VRKADSDLDVLSIEVASAYGSRIEITWLRWRLSSSVTWSLIATPAGHQDAGDSDRHRAANGQQIDIRDQGGHYDQID